MSTWITRMAALIIIAAMITLAGCNSSSSGGFTGDSDNEEPGNGENGENGEPVTGADIGRVVVTGSNTLPTGTDTRLQLEVLVLDDANRIKEGVEVIPSSDDDDLFFEPAGDSGWVTNESGRLPVYVTTPENPENRTASVTMQADGETSPPFPVEITGTNWTALEAPSSAPINEFATLELALRDSTGSALQQHEVNAEGNTSDMIHVDPMEGETDNSGRFSVDFLASAYGDFHVLVSGAGAEYQHNFAVDQFTIGFTDPDEGGELWSLGTDIDITVQLMEGDTPLADEEIRFNASRGTLGASGSQETAQTDGDGEATVTISSDDIGPTRITAKAVGRGVETSTTAQFVTDNAEFIDLQAVPAIVRPRDTEDESDAGDESVSRIVAKVTDNAGQPVQGVRVGFNLSNGSGGELRSNTATTDLFGRASVEYVAGRFSSSDQGIAVTGYLTDDTDLEDKVRLTASAQALYITLGSGNETLDINETTYAQPYTAVITDSSGQPVADTEVSMSVWSTAYRRGFLVWREETERWEIDDNMIPCDSEDQTRGGNINLEHDVSETGNLLPGNVAALAPAGGATAGTTFSITTDENGFADFEIRYPKDYAQWVRVELRATVGDDVAGTEGERLRSFWLPVADEDVNDFETLPPGYDSPFGTGRPGETDRCAAFPEDYDWQESFRDEFLQQ